MTEQYPNCDNLKDEIWGFKINPQTILKSEFVSMWTINPDGTATKEPSPLERERDRLKEQIVEYNAMIKVFEQRIEQLEHKASVLEESLKNQK